MLWGLFPSFRKGVVENWNKDDVLSSDQCKVIGFVSSKLNFNYLYSNKCMTFCWQLTQTSPPEFMNNTLKELGIGTHHDVAVVGINSVNGYGCITLQ